MTAEALLICLRTMKEACYCNAWARTSIDMALMVGKSLIVNISPPRPLFYVNFITTNVIVTVSVITTNSWIIGINISTIAPSLQQCLLF
jgi:hypothetical protein